MANPTDRGAAGKGESSLESTDIFNNVFDEAAGEGTAGTDGASGISGEWPEVKDGLPEPSSVTQSTSGTMAQASTQGTSGVTSADEDKAEQKYRTLQGILKAEKDKWEKEKAERDAEIERLRAAGTAGTAAQTKKFWDDPYAGLSEEDKKSLKDYDTEYDTVSKFEAIKRKAELAALEGKLTDSVRKEFQQAFEMFVKSMAPVLTTTEEISDERHFGAIKKEHADFEKYRDDGSIESWINSKPKYLQDAFTKVYNEGSSQDVIDLLNTFKKENNIGPPVNTDSGTAGTSAAPNRDREKKKEALAGVPSRKTPTKYDQIGTDDYAGAFDEAAKKL